MRDCARNATPANASRAKEQRASTHDGLIALNDRSQLNSESKLARCDRRSADASELLRSAHAKQTGIAFPGGRREIGIVDWKADGIDRG
jgi:hypothetical protein